MDGNAGLLCTGQILQKTKTLLISWCYVKSQKYNDIRMKEDMDLECVDFGWVIIYAAVESIDCSSFKNDQQFLE